jgi:hypothetical protein
MSSARLLPTYPGSIAELYLASCPSGKMTFVILNARTKSMMSTRSFLAKEVNITHQAKKVSISFICKSGECVVYRTTM